MSHPALSIEGTQRTDPPVGSTPRVGPQPAKRRSAALADEAQAEVRRIRGRLAELDAESHTLTQELFRLQGIVKASGVQYGDDA